MDRAVSRRVFLAGVAGAVGGSRLMHAQEAPTVVKRVEKLYKVAGSTQPNDLQFVPEGLWVLDQLDQPTNKAFLVRPEDGTVLRAIRSEEHTSELQSPCNLVCRLLLEKQKENI